MSELSLPQGEMRRDREQETSEALGVALQQLAHCGVIPVDSVEVMKIYLGVEQEELSISEHRLGIRAGDRIGATLSRKLTDERDGFVSHPRPWAGEIMLLQDMLGNAQNGRAPIPREEAIEKNRSHLVRELGFEMLGNTLPSDEPIPKNSIDTSIVRVLDWLNEPLRRIHGV